MLFLCGVSSLESVGLYVFILFCFVHFRFCFCASSAPNTMCGRASCHRSFCRSCHLRRRNRLCLRMSERKDESRESEVGGQKPNNSDRKKAGRTVHERAKTWL